MKQFYKYTVGPCTAVALCDGENESRRQSAVYVTTVTDGGERVEHVVFGWNYADLETEADFDEMCADSSAWEPLTDEHDIEF